MFSDCLVSMVTIQTDYWNMCMKWTILVDISRQKHEIYHPSIKMRSRAMWKKWQTDQQCVELVILQVSAKEDITVNLFRNNTGQKYLKSHITDHRCRIIKLHRFFVSNPQEWIRDICWGSGHCPHKTVLLHVHQIVERFFFNSSLLVSLFQE